MLLSNKRATHAVYVKPITPLPGQFRGTWRYFYDYKSALTAYEQTIAISGIYSDVQLVQLYYQTLMKKESET